MDFGEQFRAEHPSLSNLMGKSELDAYAEKLESKINTTSFDKDHDTIFVKNSTLTKEQIDYLQLKLDIYIYRLNQEEIALNPFETCDVEASETKADVFMEQGLAAIVTIVTFIIAVLLVCNIPSSFWSLLNSSILIFVVFLLCVVSLLALIAYGFAYFINIIVSNYENEKYITKLKERNRI